MRGSLLLALALIPALAGAHDPASNATPAQELDLAMLAAQADALHDQPVSVQGTVCWAVCQHGTCLLQLCSSQPEVPRVLVRHHGEIAALDDLRGRQVRAQGLYYQKVYPAYRMARWQALGWRADEPLPEAALVRRVQAAELDLLPHDGDLPQENGPLQAWTDARYDMHAMELERAGTSAGRKCLAPGARTPAHGTGAIQELLYGLQGQLQVTVGSQNHLLEPATALLIPPATQHEIRNASEAQACYLFVTSTPRD